MIAGRPHGSPWGPHWFPWVPMGPHGSPWVPMGPHGSPWVPKSPHGSPWVPKGSHGFPMGLQGFPWVPVGPHGPMGSPWVTMVPPGSLDVWIHSEKSDDLPRSGVMGREMRTCTALSSSFFLNQDRVPGCVRLTGHRTSVIHGIRRPRVPGSNSMVL